MVRVETIASDADRPALPLAAAGEAGLVDIPGSDDAGPVAATEPGVIEPGRALAIADFAAPTLGAGARLVRFAYRLGVSGATLSAPLRKPARPRLTATVANPLAGSRVVGTALRAGHFLVHGLKLPIAQADFAASRLPPPVERLVHGGHWLADLEAAAPREAVAPVAQRIFAAWLAANPAPPARAGGRAAWSIANAGARLTNWLVHAPLILSGEPAARAAALEAIARTARWLDRQVTNAEDPLAAAAGWAAIAAAGLLLPDGRPRLLYAEAGLAHALGEMLGDDGGLLSRSPLGQMEAIAALVKLSACYRATRADPPRIVGEVIRLMVPPLLALAHGDGSLGSWQGGWAVSADEVARLVEASGVRARPLRDVRQWGYQRVAAGKSLLQFDGAPPPLAKHARAACASTLAFELSHAGHRLIVNCGGAAAAGGLIPLRLEQGLRATAAHSTLVVGDANSTAILINGGIGTGVGEVEIDRRSVEAEGTAGGRANWGATRLEASHDGYAARHGLIHRRVLILRDDGTELRGEDSLVPQARKGKRGLVAYAIRFHLGQGIETGRSDDGQGVGLALPDGSYWQFRSGDGEVSVEESIWADGEGRPSPAQQLVMQGMVSRGGGSFSWLLKKMG